ncbi:SusC/RagA family TonB-linked outer membrane protein [Winogradskyella bathintestinalis]|uniref:SusC/RagA family TonB-linked outer membrane protein n=1 Tax=Winogradskyella bathintestinalis TaxID=3035208 RepID=A0ABT7ZQH7_9FLAO|nr:SusC/RagA family TonB-linked outer membrane protein [Winogradskyella bathintestinalis]MDN3491224.1 SusC/RagA family TonB-linked outer membrane protein [Winogradskyella bathintestinalis]
MKTVLNALLFCLILLPATVMAQSTATGTVTDKANAMPLPGVNVIIKGTSRGTSTDFDGNYSIEVAEGEILTFSYVGYTTQEITFTGQTTINVAIVEDAALLDEVVLIGYGSVRKEDATGSVDLVTSKDFNQGAIVSADQLLQGKAAGVRITTSGGSPDAAPNIRIRGGASLSANNSPLIVIDGIPLDNGGTAGVSNPLNLINPNDIDSFSILKDASATAIYGSRASNGVIIITTKKGTSSTPQYTFTANTSISNLSDSNLIDVMNSNEFVDFIQEFHPNETNKLGVPVGSVFTNEVPSQVITDSDGNLREIYSSNWQDAVLRTAISSDYNFSARANLFQKIPFRASIGYNDTEGLVNTDDYERLSASLKLTPTFLNEHLKIDLNAKGIYIDKNSIDGDGALGGSLTIDPTKPIYDDNSIFGGYYAQTGSSTSNSPNALVGAYNPLALLYQRSRPEEVKRLLANIKFDYKLHFFPEITAVLNLGTESSRTKIVEEYSENAIATYRQTETAGDFIFNPGVNFRENQHITNTTMDAYLMYNKDLSGFIKKIDAQAGYAYQNFKNDGNKEEYVYASTLEQGEVGTRILNFDRNNPNNRYYNVLNLQSFFGRTNINLNDKYLITLSLRADGSSLFTEDNRWGYFPAAALAWKLKEETFLQNIDFVNDFKLRLSWGETGQQDITGLAGFFPSVPLFELGSPNSQYLSGANLYSAKEFNPDLTWEKSTTYNLGVDFAFFNSGLLSGSFDIFKRNTSDLLVITSVPPGQGLSDRIIQNVGETESEGFELNLNIDALRSDDFNISLNGNVSYAKTEVTNLKGADNINQSPTIPNGTGSFLFQHALGEEAYSALVFKQVYDESGNPIPNAFVDLNGDNQITNEDRYYQAIRPNWTFGFGLNLDYKNWDLSASFRGQFDGKIYNSARLVAGYTDRPIETLNEALNNVLNFNSDAANPVFDDIQDNQAFSDYFLENASFLRCENIALGYTVNEILKNTRLKIYGSVTNPFLVTDYSGQDPENFNGLDNNFYPRPTIYTIGVNLDF